MMASVECTDECAKLVPQTHKSLWKPTWQAVTVFFISLMCLSSWKTRSTGMFLCMFIPACFNMAFFTTYGTPSYIGCRFLQWIFALAIAIDWHHCVVVQAGWVWLFYICLIGQYVLFEEETDGYFFLINLTHFFVSVFAIKNYECLAY